MTSTHERGEEGDRGGRAGTVTGRRLHPITPWRRAWAPITALAGVVLQDVERSQSWLASLGLGWLLLVLAALLSCATAYGFGSWWVTRFSVTPTELRIRSGLLFRRTAHIRLDRLQAVDVTRPLLARAVGVAKLKLDVVGAEAKDELAYLGEVDARALRAELLARAAGIAPEAAPDAGEAPSRVLLRVDTRTLATALALLGSGWLALLGLLLLPPLLWYLLDTMWVALGAAVSLLGALGRSGLGRFLREYDWTVAESPDGLRLDHGLLDREHATVPPGRVQCVRLVQPLLWRRRDWVRVELEVAGGDAASGLLLPVAPRELAETLLARVLPEVDIARAAASATPSPRRARWCAPIRWRGYRHGATEQVFVARHGRLRRVLTLVPHAKVQSVRLTQGPWAGLFGLVDLHVDHGASGTATARLRDAESARRAVAVQANRSRTGRRTARPERWLTGG